MCRLFALLSSEPVSSEPWLHRPSRSLLALSHIDKKRLQGDGWGVGWFRNSHPSLVKSAAPMYRDGNKVRQAARKANSRAIIGHVRWASNPLKLKRGELIGTVHSQPFSHGKWLFAYNGTLYIPKEVAAALGPWKKYIKGKNDSEVLFYWLL